MSDDPLLRRRHHRRRGGRHRHRSAAGALPAPLGDPRAAPSMWAPVRPRPTRRSCTPASTPSPEAWSRPWSGGATSCSRPTRGRRASRSRGRGPSWWPGTRNRRRGSTACSPRHGPTDTNAATRLTLEELRRRETAPRTRGHRGRGHPRRVDHLPVEPEHRVRDRSGRCRCRTAARHRRHRRAPRRRHGPLARADDRGAGPDRVGRQRGRRLLRSGRTGWFGHDEFTIAPRRGQLIVFDKLARPLVSSIVLPVPTQRTKGVLVAPTVYGNVLLGPTAEDMRRSGGHGHDGARARRTARGGASPTARPGRRGGHGDLRRRARRHRAPRLPDHDPRARALRLRRAGSARPA